MDKMYKSKFGYRMNYCLLVNLLKHNHISYEIKGSITVVDGMLDYTYIVGNQVIVLN